MYLRVALTEQCNLRCTYCLPEQAELRPGMATSEELQDLIRAMVAVAGVQKIRYTGGEPTLVPDLEGFVALAAQLVQSVRMTSNGVRLAGRVVGLRRAGLGGVNISLDAADRLGFQAITRRDAFDHVVDGVRASVRAGIPLVKLNAVATTVIDPAALVRFAVSEGVHIRFIELMDVGQAHDSWREQHIPAQRIRERLVASGVDLREATHLDEPTSRVWTIDGVDPHTSSVGFITAVSAPFCGTCDRIRLTCHGRLHTCLFDEAGLDLLAPLRDGRLDEVHRRIRAAVRTKSPPPSFTRRVPMAAIGG